MNEILNELRAKPKWWLRHYLTKKERWYLAYRLVQSPDRLAAATTPEMLTFYRDLLARDKVG